MKRGARVEYVGNLTTGLKGRRGAFQGLDRNGWVLVLFDCNPVEPVKCSAVNLKVVANDNNRETV